MAFKGKVAGLRGVEPPTTWFVARCSIQLSYRPAETTHAFLLDYDTPPATSTAHLDESFPLRKHRYQCRISHHDSLLKRLPLYVVLLYPQRLARSCDPNTVAIL